MLCMWPFINCGTVDIFGLFRLRKFVEGDKSDKLHGRMHLRFKGRSKPSQCDLSKERKSFGAPRYVNNRTTIQPYSRLFWRACSNDRKSGGFLTIVYHKASVACTRALNTKRNAQIFLLGEGKKPLPIRSGFEPVHKWCSLVGEIYFTVRVPPTSSVFTSILHDSLMNFLKETETRDGMWSNTGSCGKFVRKP